MKEVMGLINDTRVEDELGEIVKPRSTGAVPLGGRYRVIDFALSNLTNSGIGNVGILTQSKYRALMDHVQSGQEWDLVSKRDGLFILPPFHAHGPEGHWRGDVDHIQGHMDYIQRSRQDYVIFSNANIICNIRYQEAYAFHREKEADITILYQKDQGSVFHPGRFTLLDMDERGVVQDLAVRTGQNISPNISLEQMIINKEVLVELIDSCVARGLGDFVKDGLIRNMHRLKVYGYPIEGYVARIDSIPAYYRFNMDLLQREIYEQIFSQPGFIHTKVKDEPPARYAEGARVRNSMVANGCVVEGTVENSILFRDVTVQKGAHIKDSIIMQHGIIEEGALLQHIIMDKNGHITGGTALKGEEQYPMVIAKGQVI